jgi:Cys-tRNA(Pro)/Cys-tRNA(Cys) deacylase
MFSDGKQDMTGIKNNVTRLLEAKKIPFQAFELPDVKLSALEMADRLHVPPQQLFKSIVVTRKKPGKPIIAIVPATCEVDLKAVATLMGEKKVTVPSLVEAEKITGLQAGGISPLALLNKGFVFVIDQSAMKFAEIHISGGQRSINILLPVKSLVEITHARAADICEPLHALED